MAKDKARKKKASRPKSSKRSASEAPKKTNPSSCAKKPEKIPTVSSIVKTNLLRSQLLGACQENGINTTKRLRELVQYLQCLVEQMIVNPFNKKGQKQQVQFSSQCENAQFQWFSDSAYRKIAKLRAEEGPENKEEPVQDMYIRYREMLQKRRRN